MIMMGAMCDVITSKLRGLRFIDGEFSGFEGPWFIDTYIVKEYAAATNLITPNGIIITLVVIVEHVINIISAIRLQEGGAAILAAAIINHIIDIVGIIIFIPLFMIKLRELE